ncbi:MAG: putative sugar nucleotidyl transferase, partial [Bacteroidales bacterium]|nr:putative sugar nucleotidyl transferase [Bacteroidales bacterium]
MNLILFDNIYRFHLLPLTFTRPAADIRCGILTIREKWEKRLHLSSSSMTEEYLQVKFPLHTDEDNLFILGSLLPNSELV